MDILDTSVFKFTNRICDYCGHKSFVHRISVVFVATKFEFVQCPNCDLVFQNPLLTKDSRHHLYETKEYWDARGSNITDKKILNYYSYVGESENRRKTNQYRINWITSRLPPNSRILEIGCGDGLFVSMLKDRGYKAFGIDISQSMADIAKKKYGIEILIKDAERNLGFEAPFDAIVCYTISNFINPSLVFKNISMNLRKGGYFFFNFADCDHLFSRLLSHHFYVYRPSAAIVYPKKTIISYINKYQMEVEELAKDIQIIPLARTVSMLGLPYFLIFN